MHTIFSTQCSSYFDWQSIVLAHSFRASGQPGKLTRLLSCKPEDLARVRQTRSVVFDIVDTFVTDDATDNTAIGCVHTSSRCHPLCIWRRALRFPHEDAHHAVPDYAIAL